jgi:hAT family C-terminal dimerisation region
MFDNLLRVKDNQSKDDDEISRYLDAGTEHVDDPIEWWVDHRDTYPHLFRMALDYLTIPGTFYILCF